MVFHLNRIEKLQMNRPLWKIRFFTFNINKKLVAWFFGPSERYLTYFSKFFKGETSF